MERPYSSHKIKITLQTSLQDQISNGIAIAHDAFTEWHATDSCDI